MRPRLNFSIVLNPSFLSSNSAMRLILASLIAVSFHTLRISLKSFPSTREVISMLLNFVGLLGRIISIWDPVSVQLARWVVAVGWLDGLTLDVKLS